MSKSLRIKIWSMYYEGYQVHQIADALDISQYDVIRVLKPNGF